MGLDEWLRDAYHVSVELDLGWDDWHATVRMGGKVGRGKGKTFRQALRAAAKEAGWVPEATIV